MCTFPDHLPVLALTPPETAGQRELYGKLLALLEADGILVSRSGNFNWGAFGQGLIGRLTRTDLLLVDRVSAVHLPCLMFAPEDSSHSQGPDPRIVCRSSADLQACAARIRRWLKHCNSATPLAGAVLIGGRSSRMGRPKHLLRHEGGDTWLERALTTLTPFVGETFVSGAGQLPAALGTVARVEDLPGLQGPLAGIGALVRHRPFSSWLVLACDLPDLEPGAIDWLLSQRRGRWRALLPKNPSTGRSEPLLAWYDYRAGPLIEKMIAEGETRIGALGIDELTGEPWIPADLSASWRNVNYPEEVGSRDPSGL